MGDIKQRLTLEERQSLGLRILKDVHVFCSEHGIRYSVAYGTMIGAIRHHGFIPWDDDIDIIMPRPDYARFCNEYRSPDFKLSCFEMNRNCMMGIARVYDDNLTFVESPAPWSDENVGVWIDVFPADAVSDNPSEARKNYFACRRQYLSIYHDRCARMPLNTFGYHLVPTIKLLIKKVITFNGSFVRKHVERLIKMCSRYEYGSTGHWSQQPCISYKSFEYNEMDTFSECHEVVFEDTKVMMMDGAEKVLDTIYSNFRELPPESERVPRGSGFDFYWKKNI